MKIIKVTKIVSDTNKILQNTINENIQNEEKLIYINRIALVIIDIINKTNSIKENKEDKTNNILKNINYFETIGIFFNTLLALTNTFAIEVVALSDIAFYLLVLSSKSVIKLNNKLTNIILDKNIENLYKLLNQCKKENEKLLPNKINKKESIPQININTIKYTNNRNLVKKLKK